MSIPLTEALQQVELEPGRSYRCRVKDYLVELRVHAIPPELSPAPLDESDIMLDAWVELPEPAPAAILQSTLSQPEPPDIPSIPTDDEGA